MQFEEQENKHKWKIKVGRVIIWFSKFREMNLTSLTVEWVKSKDTNGEKTVLHLNTD